MKISKRTMEALRTAGNYRLEPRKRHIRVFVGDMMVGIVPGCVRGDGQSAGRAERNVIAQIRRATRMVAA